MDLRLTVVDARDDGRPLDLLVTAPQGATLGHLTAALPRHSSSESGWYVDGSALSEQSALGMPPLLDGASLTTAVPTSEAGPRPVDSLLELHVAEGPDCGRVVRLPLGRTRIGRTTDSDLCLHDPALSRVHAQLELGHDGILLIDRGTTNGTLVAGERVPPGEGTPVQAGQRIRLGGSTLVLRVPRVRPAATQPDGSGHLGLNRGPREHATEPTARLTRPTPPDPPERARVAVLTLLLPLLLSLVLAYVLDSAVMLLFGLMGPVMMASSQLSDRRGGRLRHRRALAHHLEDLQEFGASLARALEAEVRWRHLRAPDLAELLVTARERGDRLWCRRPADEDFLRLRLGHATLPAVTTVTDREGREDHPLLPDVPLEVSLPEVGVLGIAAPAATAAACVRGLVAQVVGWHSPRDVRLVVLLADLHRVEPWAWLPWLPHARLHGGNAAFGLLGAHGATSVSARLAELGSLLDERQDRARRQGGRPRNGPTLVVVLDGARRLRAEAGVARLLEEGPSVGVHTICADAQVARLPAECGATLDLTPPGPEGRFDVASSPHVAYTPSLVPQGWIERLARHLAPLRDATPEEVSAQPPVAARLLDVLDTNATDAAVVRAGWHHRPRSTSFVLGVGADRPETVDLRQDGPHALVGGTTGAGKSELLQTMIASLAVVNRPDEMVFVLVDYKGGSAFKDCARLPHTAGLVTDLDGHLTARALTSLEAELRRRERILGAAGAKDLEDYQRLAAPDAVPVPRLVLVIDEFKMLAEDLPDFVDGLVKLAAVGRSLGVHLVLATQRPGGIVSSDIKANVNLRIALRVRDRVDSEDVLEDPAAAAISGRTPGRALLRSGSAPLRLFQTARVCGHAEGAEPSSVTVQPLSLTSPADMPTGEASDAGAGPTDLCRVVDATLSAAAAAGIARVASPWLPPLPEAVAVPPSTGAGTWRIPYAVADLPHEQRRCTLEWDLEHDGHLAFAGSARSGRTTALRTISGSLATRFTPGQVHLHAFDGSGGLRALTGLPHSGVIVGRDEPARGLRLLQRLLAEVSDRQSTWAEHGYSSVAEQHDDAAPGRALPYLVLLVDDWDTFTAAYEDIDAGRPVEMMHQLLREGPSVGLRAAVTGGRSVLLSRVAALVPGRFCLRMSDESDLLLAGLPTASVPAAMPPGRALRVADGVELQVAVLPDGTKPADAPPVPAGRAQVRVLRRLGEATTARERESATPLWHRPLRVQALPRSITLSEATAEGHNDTRADTRADTTSLVLGVGGDDLLPILLDPGEGLSFLVAGPAGSGRTTTLELLAGQLLEHRRTVLVVAEAGSPLSAWAMCSTPVTAEPSDRHRIRDLIRDHPDAVGVVDDVERLPEATADVLSELVRTGRHTGGGVVCAGMTHELLTQFRGLAVEVRRAQTGLLLQPSSPADGEVFALRATPLRERFPGRGLHVHRGRLTATQVALPDSP